MQTRNRTQHLHPDSEELLRRADELGLLSDAELTIDEARELELRERELMGPSQAVGDVRDATAPGPGGPVPIRIYTPHGNAPFPLLLFFHGGGWVMGSLAHADVSCRSLAASSGHVVVSVGYRLAPEHPFPAPLDDCYAATKWVEENRELLYADAAPLAVAGNSAGGNLTAAVALLARDTGGPEIGVQVLLFPALDPALTSRSHEEFAEGYWLTREDMRRFWELYLGGRGPADAPYASPNCVDDLRNLPPAFVATAEFDVLRDEGEDYAARLQDAGVPVRLSRYPGMLHSFWEYAGVVKDSALVTAEIAAALGATKGIEWRETLQGVPAEPSIPEPGPGT